MSMTRIGLTAQLPVASQIIKPVISRLESLSLRNVIPAHRTQSTAPRVQAFASNAMDTAPAKAVLIFGHRGAAGHSPENSLHSITKAIELGSDFIELDVHAVEDELVVFHDHRLERLTGHPGRIDSLTLQQIDQMRSLGQPIPRLQDVVRMMDARAGLNIELKGFQCADIMARYFRTMMDKGWRQDQIIVSSFDYPQLARLKDLEPQVRIGALLESQPTDYAKSAEAMNAYSIHVNQNVLTPEYIADAHNRDLKVFAYTPNFIDDMSRLIALGVDGLITDYPDRAAGLLRGAGES